MLKLHENKITIWLARNIKLNKNVSGQVGYTLKGILFNNFEYRSPAKNHHKKAEKV